MKETQKEYLRKYNLNRYYRLKTEGICVTCQKNQAAPKRTQCKKCNEDSRVSARLTFNNKAGKEIYFQLFQEQGGKCKICNEPMLRPALDHSHATGEVRGLLCPSCNSGLGFFKDNPEALAAAARYVQFSRVNVKDYIKPVQKKMKIGENHEKRIFTKTGYEVLD